MKALILELILVAQILLSMMPVAVAAIGPRPDPNPAPGHPLLGRNFCLTEGPANTGWGFSPQGFANYFAPNIGAPNPWVATGAQFLDESRFVLSSFDKRTGQHLSTSAILYYDRASDSILMGTARFHPSACRRFR
jgi:hypothetical protein